MFNPEAAERIVASRASPHHRFRGLVQAARADPTTFNPPPAAGSAPSELAFQSRSFRIACEAKARKEGSRWRRAASKWSSCCQIRESRKSRIEGNAGRARDEGPEPVPIHNRQWRNVSARDGMEELLQCHPKPTMPARPESKAAGGFGTTAGKAVLSDAAEEALELEEGALASGLRPRGRRSATLPRRAGRLGPQPSGGGTSRCSSAG